jgi:hypothetical protein
MTQDSSLSGTRRALHAVAEMVLAGPQLVASDSIELRPTPGGFGTVSAPDVLVVGCRLVTPSVEEPINGSTAADLAIAVGVTARPLDDVYAGGPGVPVDEVLVVDEASAAVLADAFALGEAALRSFAPEQRPVLWPEHFDIGITVGEVNYGVSPGDARSPVPYAYVGPWSVPTGDEFWNAPFGATRELSTFGDADALAQFFRAGQQHAAA